MNMNCPFLDSGQPRSTSTSHIFSSGGEDPVNRTSGMSRQKGRGRKNNSGRSKNNNKDFQYMIANYRALKSDKDGTFTFLLLLMVAGKSVHY